MAGFGEELRLERESRGVSLAALSTETKVSVRHFEALEHGQFHELPGGVFRRGILRAYLKSLGLGEEDWMPRFEMNESENARALGLPVALEEEAWVEFATNVKRNRVGPQRSTGLRWVGVAAMLVALAAAGWAVWFYQIRLTH